MLAQFRPGIVLVAFVALGGLALTLIPILRRRMVSPEGIAKPAELEPAGN
jgi:hypothetical protein